jgi:hypothetical protein
LTTALDLWGIPRMFHRSKKWLEAFPSLPVDVVDEECIIYAQDQAKHSEPVRTGCEMEYGIDDPEGNRRDEVYFDVIDVMLLESLVPVGLDCGNSDQTDRYEHLGYLEQFLVWASKLPGEYGKYPVYESDDDRHDASGIEPFSFFPHVDRSFLGVVEKNRGTPLYRRSSQPHGIG